MKLRDLRTLPKDDSGAIIVFWAVCLTVILGIVALSFDFGQKAATQSELQSFADQVALAAAGELDGKADAITRSTNAAANLIIDQQTFATGARALAGSTNYTLTFYRTLPGSDTASIDPGLTTDPALARYVRARSVPRTVPFTFMAAFDALRGGTTANPQIGATAVAGFTQFACDITPLMFCIPSSTFKAKDNIGKMIWMRAGGSGSAWGPGNFGFLDPTAGGVVDPNGPCAGLGSGPMLACLLGASGAITQCFSQRGVNTEPGQKVGIVNVAFNTRFDMYSGMMSGDKNRPLYAPAPNVIKGMKPASTGGNRACNPQPASETASLPRDNCFYTNTCANGGRFGDGNWSNALTGRPNYVTRNYGATDPHPSATTRYAYYLAEIAAHGGGASTARILPASEPETGRPQCSNQQSPNPERRVLVAAGIDCAANPVNGSATNIPVQEFVKVFLTEPVGATTTFDMFVEVVGPAETGSGTAVTGGIFHDVVQLYR